MNGHAERERRIADIVGWTTRISELDGAWDPVEQRIHLRPSARGIRVVDIDLRRPQLDRGQLRGRDLRARLSQLLALPPRPPPGRDTPEKRLQSWLIANAYATGRRLVDIDSSLNFITDEQRFVGLDGSSRVCDLLVLHVVDAVTRPAVIELKPAREMARLERQLAGFAAIVDAHASAFERLFGAVLRRRVVFTGPCEKWIVWPALPGHPIDPRAGELASRGVRIVGWEVRAGEYVLRAAPALIA